MPSAVIQTIHSYPAFTDGTITGTLAVCLSRSSRTRERSLSIFYAHAGYGPNCLATFWTQLTYRFNGRTAQPLGRTTAPGCDEPTSRCQTSPSIGTLGGDQPVIPRVTFIRWVTTFPHSIVRSLRPTFVSARLVCLAVKHPYANALDAWFPIRLRVPSRASVTFWEATAPVKLPTRQCPSPCFKEQVRFLRQQGWYFKVASIRSSDLTSKAPTYPTHAISKITAKLQ